MTLITDYRVRFNITPTQARILELLSNGEFWSTRKLLDTVSKPSARLNNIRVLMSNLRRKIAPIEITTLYGAGYCINEWNLKLLRGEQ